MEELLIKMDLDDALETLTWAAEGVQKYKLKPNTTLVTLYARAPASVKI
jgi:hypothetical protein